MKTYLHGYKKLDCFGKGQMINNPDKWSKCMYKMAKTAENGLTEDLIITGYHSIMVDALTKEQEDIQSKILSCEVIDGKKLLLSSVSDQFQKIDEVKHFTYYNFSLENNGDNNKRYGVWANGLLTETTSKTHLIRYCKKYDNVIY